MEQAFDIIVVILSVSLFVFLVIGVIATVLMIKLIKSLRAVVDKGEALVDKAEAIGESIRENASAVGLVSLLTKMVSLVGKSKRR